MPSNSPIEIRGEADIVEVPLAIQSVYTCVATHDLVETVLKGWFLKKISW
jgi:hypothetical protein